MNSINKLKTTKEETMLKGLFSRKENQNVKEVKKMRKLLLFAILMLCVSFSYAAIAQADTVGSQMYDGYQQFDDNDAERLNVDVNVDGWLNVGDTLRGVFNMNEILNLNSSMVWTGEINSLGAGSVNEMTGLFEIEVLTMSFVSVGLDTFLGTGDDLYDYTFGPYAPFDNGLDGIPGNADDLPIGAIIAAYEDPSQDFAVTEATATNGTLALVLGFDGLDADEQWTARGPLDPTLAAAAVSGGVANLGFNYQVSILLNQIGKILLENTVPAGCGILPGNPCILPVGDMLADTVGSGSFQTTAIVGWDASTDTQLIVNVPEPGTLLLLGIGLLGIGGFSRRMLKK